MALVISKAAGRRKELLPRWDLPLPPVGSGGGDPLTLRALIGRIVRLEVAAYNQRQKQARFITVLSDDEIREAARKGRVSSGGREHDVAEVGLEEAVGAALQAFEDGMYLVLIDDTEQTDLDRQVFLTDESTITFIRLTFLAGG